MDAIYLLVKNIVVIVIISAILEMIVPAGNFKSIVAFALGLFVLFSILQPISTLLLRQEPISFKAWSWETVSPSAEAEMRTRNENFRQNLYEGSRKEAAQKIAAEIEALVGLVPGVEYAKSQVILTSDWGKQIERVEVNLQLEAEFVDPIRIGLTDSKPDNAREKIATKVAQLIQSFYDINPEQIVIEFQGGGEA